MTIALIIIIAAVGFLSYKMDRPERRKNSFYVYAFIGLAIIFITPKFMPVQSITHILIGVSVIVGHCIGVFTCTWQEW
jgi:multisubunit Na+/H+ antiporter MnhB subunit